MCGIVGAVSERQVSGVLLEGLRRLEYRGYDSAGMAIYDGTGLCRLRRIVKALHLKKREKIRYTIQPDGNVLLSRADMNDQDPVLGSFLSYLASDIQMHPEHLSAATPELVSRIQGLVGSTDVDLDAPLDEEDE